MTPIDSQDLETYEPVYDVVPKDWEEGRAFLAEQLKRHANAINIREVGYFIDQELLTGKAFIPGLNNIAEGGTSQSFRTILRKVIEYPSGLSVGANPMAHGIFIDANFSLIQMFGAATNAVALTGEPLPNGADIITYNSTNVIVTVAAAYTRAWVVMEYIQEL